MIYAPGDYIPIGVHINKARVGQAGLTVSISTLKMLAEDNSVTDLLSSIGNPGNLIDIGTGGYARYLTPAYSNFVTRGTIIGVAHTADTTVDQQDVMFAYPIGVRHAYLDGAISELPATLLNTVITAYTTANTWGKALNQLLSYLTSPISSILSAVAISFARIHGSGPASQVSVTQRDTWDETITVDPFSWNTDDILLLTLSKEYRALGETDADNAILQWQLTNGGDATDGLIYINGIAAGADRTKGSLAVLDEDNGQITVALDEAVSAVIRADSYKFDAVHISIAGDRTSLTYKGSLWTVDPTVTARTTI